MDKSSNELFYDMQVRRLVYLQQYSSKLSSQLNNVLTASEKALEEKLLVRLAKIGSLDDVKSWVDLRKLLNDIKDMRASVWGDTYSIFESELFDLAKQEPVSLTGMVQNSSPVVIGPAVPEVALLKSIVTSRPFQGAVLKDWASRMQANDLQRIQSSIQIGMTIGETTPEIVKRVVGTKGSQGTDGITQMTRNEVDAVVKTAVSHVSNNARREFLNSNGDLFDEEMYVSVLDSRTSSTCRSLDHKLFKRNTGPMPPLHFRCRSLRVAVFGSKLIGDRPAKPTTEKMLLEEYTQQNGLGTVAKRDNLPYGTKSNFDKWSRGRLRELVGPVPSSTSYPEWFAKQSKAFQLEVLGKTRTELYRKGELKLEKFVDKQYQNLTLKELAKREAEAFRRAGLNPNDY